MSTHDPRTTAATASIVTPDGKRASTAQTISPFPALAFLRAWNAGRQLLRDHGGSGVITVTISRAERVS